MSPACLNNTTIFDDLSDINLSHDSEQDQREAGPNDQTETNPNHVHHQQETVLNGSEGETTIVEDSRSRLALTCEHARCFPLTNYLILKV